MSTSMVGSLTYTFSNIDGSWPNLRNLIAFKLIFPTIMIPILVLQPYSCQRFVDDESDDQLAFVDGLIDYDHVNYACTTHVLEPQYPYVLLTFIGYVVALLVLLVTSAFVNEWIPRHGKGSLRFSCLRIILILAALLIIVCDVAEMPLKWGIIPIRASLLWFHWECKVDIGSDYRDTHGIISFVPFKCFGEYSFLMFYGELLLDCFDLLVAVLCVVFIARASLSFCFRGLRSTLWKELREKGMSTMMQSAGYEVEGEGGAGSDGEDSDDEKADTESLPQLIRDVLVSFKADFHTLIAWMGMKLVFPVLVFGLILSQAYSCGAQAAPWRELDNADFINTYCKNEIIRSDWLFLMFELFSAIVDMICIILVSMALRDCKFWTWKPCLRCVKSIVLYCGAVVFICAPVVFHSLKGSLAWEATYPDGRECVVDTHPVGFAPSAHTLLDTETYDCYASFGWMIFYLEIMNLLFDALGVGVGVAVIVFTWKKKLPTKRRRNKGAATTRDVRGDSSDSTELV
eukprot:TRINITY_DN3500_c0_g1_i1.p1 TRINITY_DN3500_c0_g1~~TRINITY_DN3500_c0_g1_i1.p1  ORF type:complete len:515 (-),score=83.03 TRINITY_DN3500_c0_g1_i1:257-1801(-)